MEYKSAPIFLHSGFRTGSTWFWSRFRNAAGTCAYYEPFNENMASLTPQRIATNRSNSWSSGHPPLAEPYNVEYLDLLHPEGGVLLYQERFAFESYYGTENDEAQQRYIAALIDHALSLGKVPVFGFCRSLGRVPWFRRTFPKGIHIVTLRNPWDQWGSISRHSERMNFYFDFKYYLIACIACQTPMYRDFFDGLVLPRPCGENNDEKDIYLKKFFHQTPLDMRLRIFLRVFLLDMSLSLENSDVFVDIDRMSADLEYRRRVTSELRRMTGLSDLCFDDCALPRHPPVAQNGEPAALEEALALIGANERLAGKRVRPILSAILKATLARFALL